MARILTGGGQDGSGNPTTATVGRPGFKKGTRTFFQSARRVFRSDPASGILGADIKDVSRVGRAFASLSTNLANATNNDLVFTANVAGGGGNNIRVRYVDPGGTTATLSVSVSGNDITVNLGRAASAINSTGQNVMDAVNAHAGASALVTASLKAANDGTGLVDALAFTALSGGTAGEMRSALPPGLATPPSTPSRIGSDQKALEPTVKVAGTSGNKAIRIR